MQAHLFDKASRQWVRIDSEGDALLTPDRTKASIIESTQLDSYIRNYELDYLKGSLEVQPLEPETGPKT